MSVEKRTKSIKIRVTESELIALKKSAGSNQLATFLREVGLNTYTPKPRKEYPKIDPVFMRKFSGACTNLNQLTRLANTHKDNLEKINLTYELTKIRTELERLKADVSSS